MTIKNFFVQALDGTVTIYLTKGKKTRVDFLDWISICERSWCADGDYCSAKIDRKKIALHKFLTGFKETDHKNHDRLDNRRVNLRDVTRTLNNANRSKQPGYSTPWKGVSLHAKRNKFRADIRLENHTQFLGIFKDPADAAMVYNEAALGWFGEFACLNDHPLNHDPDMPQVPV